MTEAKDIEEFWKNDSNPHLVDPDWWLNASTEEYEAYFGTTETESTTSQGAQLEFEFDFPLN